MGEQPSLLPAKLCDLLLDGWRCEADHKLMTGYPLKCLPAPRPRYQQYVMMMLQQTVPVDSRRTVDQGLKSRAREVEDREQMLGNLGDVDIETKGGRAPRFTTIREGNHKERLRWG